MALAALRTPDELQSPQLSAVSNGMLPRINYENYVEASAASLPALEAADYARSVQEQELKLNREAREQAARDANFALGIQGAKTVTDLATNPVLQKYGSRVWSALAPKPPALPALNYPVTSEAGFGMAPSVTSEGADIASALAPISGAPASPAIAPGMESYLPGESGNWLSNGMDKFGGQSTLGKIGTVAGSTIGAFGAGNAIASGSTPGNLRELIPSMGKKESEITSGALGGALSGFVASGFNPVGAIVGGLFGGAGSKNKCPAKIATACYGENSHAVQICREYRDKFWDRATAVGYYHTADRIVPLMEASPELTEFVRENLIMPLVRYGEWRLGYVREHPSAMDCAITKNFLTFCRDKGVVLKEYVRDGDGEVI